jgi:dolichyl-phosphate-mannose-protein mannosyltransferase
VTVIELAGSRLDDWWEDVIRRPRAALIWAWGGPLFVVLAAALTRLVDLGHPHELVFDETYYVKDAYTLMNLGYEGSWPPDANVAFNAGLTDQFQTAPSFVVHSPVGKWIIAAGLAALGAGNSFGWRIGVAIAGILLVVVTMLIARHLFKSTLLTVIAGGLLAIDGNAIVMSRVALLDTMLALLALVGAYFVLLDRGFAERRLTAWLAARTAAGRPTDWGPVLWWRPWLLGAAVAFGLATGVKWSGLYFLAGFAVYVVASEALLRRKAGVTFWLSGAVLRQAPATFVLMVPLALAVYVASWTGWFVTKGGYYRQWIETGGGEAWNGALGWVPHAVQNWWHYQAAMYSYHVNEHTPHSYQANPLTWLFLVRPTSMYYHDNGDGTAQTILGVANPLIWWAATAAAFYLVFRLVRGIVKRDADWRDGFILMGLAAGYLPWLLYLGRTVFQFYTIAFEPFLVLALTVAIAHLLGRSTDPEPRRVSGLRVVGIFLALCIVLSIFFWPMWTGQTIPTWYMRAHWWLPSWI